MTNEKHKLCGTLPTRAKAQRSPPWFGLIPLPFTGLPLDASQAAVAAVAPSPQASTATVGPGGSATRRRRAQGRPVKPGQAAAPRPPAPGRRGSGPGRRAGGLRRAGRQGRQPRGGLEEPSGPGATPCEVQGPHGTCAAPASPPDAAASACGHPRRRPSWGCLRGAGAPSPAIGGGKRPPRRHHPAPAAAVGGEWWLRGGSFVPPCCCGRGCLASSFLAKWPVSWRLQAAWRGACLARGRRQVQRSLWWGGLVGGGKGSPVRGVPGRPL